MKFCSIFFQALAGNSFVKFPSIITFSITRILIGMTISTYSRLRICKYHHQRLLQWRAIKCTEFFSVRWRAYVPLAERGAEEPSRTPRILTSLFKMLRQWSLTRLSSRRAVGWAVGLIAWRRLSEGDEVAFVCERLLNDECGGTLLRQWQTTTIQRGSIGIVVAVAVVISRQFLFHSLAIISLTRSLLAKRVGHKPVVKPPRWLRRVGLKTEGHSCTCSCKQLKRSRSFTLLLTYYHQMFFGQIF